MRFGHARCSSATDAHRRRSMSITPCRTSASVGLSRDGGSSRTPCHGKEGTWRSYFYRARDVQFDGSVDISHNTSGVPGKRFHRASTRTAVAVRDKSIDEPWTDGVVIQTGILWTSPVCLTTDSITTAPRHPVFGVGRLVHQTTSSPPYRKRHRVQKINPMRRNTILRPSHGCWPDGSVLGNRSRHAVIRVTPADLTVNMASTSGHRPESRGMTTSKAGAVYDGTTVNLDQGITTSTSTPYPDDGSLLRRRPTRLPPTSPHRSPSGQRQLLGHATRPSTGFVDRQHRQLLLALTSPSACEHRHHDSAR